MKSFHARVKILVLNEKKVRFDSTNLYIVEKSYTLAFLATRLVLPTAAIATNFTRKKFTPQDFGGRVEERVGSLAAEVVEVVEVDGPDGRATEAVVDNQVRLLRDGLDVVIADPLPSAGRVGAAAVGAGRLGQLVGGNCKKVQVVWDLGSNRRLG